MNARAPMLFAAGAALLLVSVPATGTVVLVTLTFSDPAVLVIDVVPEKIEELTAGTLTAAGAEPKAVTAVAPSWTPATACRSWLRAPCKSVTGRTWLPVVYVTVLYAVSAMAGRTPTLSAIGAAVLLLSVPDTVDEVLLAIAGS